MIDGVLVFVTLLMGIVIGSALTDLYKTEMKYNAFKQEREREELIGEIIKRLKEERKP